MAQLWTVRFRMKHIIAECKKGKWSERVEWVEQCYHALPWNTVQGYNNMQPENEFRYEPYYMEGSGKRLMEINVGRASPSVAPTRDYSSIGNGLKKTGKKGKGGVNPSKRPVSLPKTGNDDYAGAINSAMAKSA